MVSLPRVQVVTKGSKTVNITVIIDFHSLSFYMRAVMNSVLSILDLDSFDKVHSGIAKRGAPISIETSSEITRALRSIIAIIRCLSVDMFLRKRKIAR